MALWTVYDEVSGSAWDSACLGLGVWLFVALPEWREIPKQERWKRQSGGESSTGLDI